MAIQHDENAIQPWINLGSFYLSVGQYELAHQAFSTSQALDPSEARGWIGQAFVAEVINHGETLDLYRHSYELSPHPQACLGFAYHVVASLSPQSAVDASDLFNSKSPSKNKSIPAGYESHYVANAAVALSKYVHSDGGTQDACAYNLQGLLFEMDNQTTSAETSYLWPPPRKTY